MGSRLLRLWLHHPLRDRAVLASRHEAVAMWHETDFHKFVRGMSEVERIPAGVGLRRVRPRELAGLRESLKLLPGLVAAIPHSSLLDELRADLALPGACVGLLEKTLHIEPSARVIDGGVIADGHSADLDELRKLQTHASDFLIEMEKREKERTGIPNLRVAYNQVHGYYIEVTNAHAGKVPDDYRRRQTLKNAERYITPELKTFEDKALSARDRSLALEKSLYEELLQSLQAHVPVLQRIARGLAQVDVLCSFSSVAAKRNYSRPVFVEDSLLEREAGRHPVVGGQIHRVLANDCRLSPARRPLLITGPHLGGQSAYIRPGAL